MQEREEDIQSQDSEIERLTEVLENLSQNDRARTAVLLGYQQKFRELQEELEFRKQEEINKIYQRYEQVQKEITRSLNGEIVEDLLKKQKGSDEKLLQITNFITEEEAKKIQANKTCKPLKGYWLKVLKNCQITSQEITPLDEKILQHLTGIQSRQKGGRSKDFDLIFTFETNEYFSNKELVKNFIFEGVGQYPVQTEGTKIDWKINYSKQLKSQVQKLSGAQNSKKLLKELSVDGFFSFFDATKEPDLEIEEEDIDHEQVQKHTWHYDMGNFIAFTTIPKSLEFYLGVNYLEDDDEDRSFNHYEDEGEDDEDEDDDDEDNQEDSDDSEPEKPANDGDDDSEDEDEDAPTNKKPTKQFKSKQRGNKIQQKQNPNLKNTNSKDKSSKEPQCKQQ